MTPTAMTNPQDSKLKGWNTLSMLAFGGNSRLPSATMLPSHIGTKNIELAEILPGVEKQYDSNGPISDTSIFRL